MRLRRRGCLLLILSTIISGCMMPAKLTPSPPSLQTRHAKWLLTLTPDMANDNDDEPVTAATPAPLTNQSEQEPFTDVSQMPTLFLSPGLPPHFTDQIDLEPFEVTSDENQAETKINIGLRPDNSPVIAETMWVYALAAPFYTLTDNMTMDTLTALWRGERPEGSDVENILVTAKTASALLTLLGPPDDDVVKVVSPDMIVELSETDEPVLAILPFEDLNPRWKVIRLDGLAPINHDFRPQTYPLTLQIWVESNKTNLPFTLPSGNYDPSLRTILIMTGVTALTRATAHRMEIHGNNYPGRDIQNWLETADLTHISHEVPFTADCPYPDPVQRDLIFCADPERIGLFEHIGADIIELSGNHLLDYGTSAIEQTLEMYQTRGMQTFAGGWDLEESRTPLKVTHNGNNLAFIGCNAAGPPNVWATANSPGAAPCSDYGWLIDEIRQSLTEGYLPIVALQYLEDYTAYPSAQMAADFQSLAQAGAVVVNGSQAHTPKTMTFYQGSFLHYGLGNLFFDQMEVYYNETYLPGTRDEFIDRLIFYDGRLISIELLTALLEDYARPRPMTTEEREAFLFRIFSILTPPPQER